MSVSKISLILRALCALTLNHKRGSVHFQIFHLLTMKEISQQGRGSTIVVNVMAMRRVTGLFGRSDFLGYTLVNTKIV